MQITITGLDNLTGKLGQIAKKQLPFAISRAINETLSGAHKAVVKEINDVFHEPTPAVQKGVRWSASTKRNLSGKIYLTSGGGGGPDIASILRPHITGADRIKKASEGAFKRHGWMGQGQWMVPGPGAPIDRYGNVPGNYMKKVIAQLKADTALGYNKMSRTAARRGVGTLYGIPFKGVFKRTGPRTSIPVLFFTYAKPRYEAGRFDFYYVVKNHAKNNFVSNFRKAFKEAMSSLRKSDL